MTKIINYVFESVGGWYVCNAESDWLDTRGRAYYNKLRAYEGIYSDWKHFDGSGMVLVSEGHYHVNDLITFDKNGLPIWTKKAQEIGLC